MLGLPFDPVLSAAVIVATAGLLGVIIGLFLVKKGINRKRILLFSGFGTAVAFLVLGLHFYCFDAGNIISLYRCLGEYNTYLIYCIFHYKTNLLLNTF
jgi:uncharacterized membrane protein YozB (DUF420 family)